MIWAPVPNSRGYEVSRSGQVRRGDRLLKPWPVSGGYLVIRIIYESGIKKCKLVHRLVCEAFIGRCPEGMECCHNNGVRTDNRLENLRYDTRLANTRDQYRHGTRVRGKRVASSKLCWAQVVEIRKRAAQGEGYRALGREFGVTHNNIGAIVRREHWPHDDVQLRTPEPADLQQVGASSRWVETPSPNGSLPTGGVIQEGG